MNDAEMVVKVVQREQQLPDPGSQPAHSNALDLRGDQRRERPARRELLHLNRTFTEHSLCPSGTVLSLQGRFHLEILGIIVVWIGNANYSNKK